MSFLKKVWDLLKPFHGDLYRILLITALFETVRMGGPYLFGRILDLLVKSKGEITIQTALYVVGGLAGVRVISLAIDHLTDWIILGTVFKAHKHISTTAYEKMVELSLDYHEKVSTGKKISLINKGTDKLIELIEGFTMEFQPVTVQLLASSIFIFLTNWKIGLVFTLSLIPFIVITFRIFEATKKMREQRHEAYEISSGEVGDTMTNISVVKSFAQEDRENEHFSSLRGLIQTLSVGEFKQRMFSGFGRNFLIEVFYIALLTIGLFEIKAGVLTIGSLVFLINMIERAYSNIYRLGRIYMRISDAREPVESLTALMSEKPSIFNSAKAITPEKIEGRISFKNVSFAYKKKRVLNNISFTIPAGSFTALVGKSGSGKSTIAKLLSRYYDPIAGSVLIDGRFNLKDLDLATYRRATAVVFQDSPVPNRQIWEIIAYAAGKTTFQAVKERVFRAAQLAHAHEFVLELEEGYHTTVGERGVKLSGGQKQRLAIARALFVQPKILIMDEPTSHLDTLSEALIQQALQNISNEHAMTKIVIAHRLSTVQKADQILVMERGRVVERGTHQQLLKQDGAYAAIVHQSELKG